MNLSRQLINLAGGLATAVILALGIALIALPMLADGNRTNKQAAETAQTNDVYRLQVETLRSQEKDIVGLQDALAELRAEIPATALNDQVYELARAAVDDTGVTIVTVAAADPDSWLVPADGAGPADDAAAAEEDAGGDPISDAEDVAADAEGGAAADAGESSPTELDPRQVVPFTIEVLADDAMQAARFLDALRAGDRLLRIDHAALVEDEGQFRLTVNARSLVLAEK